MMSFVACKPARLVIWIILSTLFCKQVLFPLIISNSLQLWTLIKRRKSIYIILNFIIISILISSTSFTPFFTKLFLKLHKSFFPSNNNNNNSYNSSLGPHHHHHHQSTYKVASSTVDDDHDHDHDRDVWWLFSLSQMDHEPDPISATEVHETASFRVPEVDKSGYTTTTTQYVAEMDHNCEVDTSLFQQVAEENESRSRRNMYCQIDQRRHNSFSSEVESNTVVGEEGEVVNEYQDSLDATWKAIMESKGKENGPHLKKSDTWSAGDGRVVESNKESGGVLRGLSKYRVTVPLKKWQSFRDMIEKREYFGGGGGGGGGVGGGDGNKRGWRSVDIALTFQDGLKKRADAFIARFTHDIRLQRLESDQRFMDMINRGF